jgi:4-hydroxybenzoate polyprenyltransferase
MHVAAARGVTPARPLWRAYLLLARVSNLPTVWTNVVAGTTIAGATFSWETVTASAAAVSLMYCGGMFLNDAFDRHSDLRQRPDRPIPAGEVSAARAFTIGFALLGAGVLVIAAAGPAQAVAWGLALSAAIVYYDWRHKADAFGPLVMGLCRGLVYCVAAASAAGVVSPAVLSMAAIMVGYVLLLTWVAKRAGPRAGVIVPLLLAGISLVDAGMVWTFGSAPLALVTAAGFVLTLLLQRVVPGT